ncbi:hypothetical protein J2T46_003226 [Pseudomonas citronellolis]|nr:hypothetical protein [Pseudomonas citronellolis]MCP1656291.1 hypothetical protein [Pseudomonas citronellolis]MCP1723164.1 hypothetical protein [Pseudomonas citronellolis]
MFRPLGRVPFVKRHKRNQKGLPRHTGPMEPGYPREFPRHGGPPRGYVPVARGALATSMSHDLLSAGFVRPSEGAFRCARVFLWKSKSKRAFALRRSELAREPNHPSLGSRVRGNDGVRLGRGGWHLTDTPLRTPPPLQEKTQGSLDRSTTSLGLPTVRHCTLPSWRNRSSTRGVLSAHCIPSDLLSMLSMATSNCALFCSRRFCSTSISPTLRLRPSNKPIRSTPTCSPSSATDEPGSQAFSAWLPPPLPPPAPPKRTHRHSVRSKKKTVFRDMASTDDPTYLCIRKSPRRSQGERRWPSVTRIWEKGS